MSDFEIGMVVVFGPLALAILVLSLIDFADRRSTTRSRSADRAHLRDLERRVRADERLRRNL
jgi:hypothetical protein